jgi:hypothetical protein
MHRFAVEHHLSARSRKDFDGETKCSKVKRLLQATRSRV